MSWTDELKDKAKTLWPTHSATQIAELLNAEHGTAFTRNSIIGLMNRMGVTAQVKTKAHPSDTYAPKEVRDQAKEARDQARQDRPPVKRKPVLRIVPGGRGGHALTIIETVTGEIPQFACDEITPRGLTLAELRPDDCRYIGSDDLYCGNPIFQRSFCRGHYHRCYTPPLRVVRAA